MPTQVLVIGAGVVGLSTALALLRGNTSHQQQQQQHIQVTVVAEQCSPHTTSDGAGAMWRPFLTGATPPEKVSRWGADTLEWLTDIARSSEGEEAGVWLCSGQEMSRSALKQEDLFWAKPLPKHGLDFKLISPAQDKRSVYDTVLQFTTPVVDPPSYLRWLMARVLKAGGRVQTRRVASLAHERACGKWDAVVNCTGEHGAELAGDDKGGIEPVRGQTIKVYAPHVKTFRVDLDQLTYIIPRQSGVVVCGGTHQHGDSDTSIRSDDAADIWERVSQLHEGLKGLGLSTVCLGHWTGLRPTRPAGVRCELDNKRSAGAPVVHNYGHGGCGHTLGWGCALHAARLVRKALQATDKKPRQLRSRL